MDALVDILLENWIAVVVVLLIVVALIVRKPGSTFAGDRGMIIVGAGIGVIIVAVMFIFGFLEDYLF